MNLNNLFTILSAIRLLFIVLVLSNLPACADSDSADERLSLIKSYMRRGDLGAASLELANLTQSHPNNLEARLLQGKVSIAAGRAAAAESQLLAARRLGAPEPEVILYLGKAVIAQGEFSRVGTLLGPRPEQPDARVAWEIVHGHATLRAGNHAAASQHFTAAKNMAPDKLGVIVGLAQLSIAQNDLLRAEELLARATEKYPLSIAAWQTSGVLRISQRRYIEAERAFINAIEGSDTINFAEEYMLARVGLIEAQWLLNKKALAKQNNKELILSYPWHPLPRYLRGVLAFLDGEYQTAQDQLQRVTAVIPKHLPSLKLLAAMNSLQGNLGQAQMYLDKFFALHPDDPDMLHLLAETYMKMGNARQAAEILKPIVAPSTTDVDLLDLYGTANLYAGNPELGTRYLQQAVKLGPENIMRQTRLAAALLNQGEIAAADQLMRGWRMQDVTERSRKTLRLERFLRSKQTRRAAEYAKKLRRENPSNLHSLLALSEMAEADGNRKVAIDWLEIARDRNKTAVEPRLILILYYLNAGEFEQARVIAQEAAAAHPYNANVLRLLAQAQLALQDTSAALASASEAARLAPLQEENQIMLIRAQLSVSDFWNARSSMVKLMLEHPETGPVIRQVIVEEFRRGNSERAFDLTSHLIARLPGRSMPYEIHGDLHTLNGTRQQAYAAYVEAMTRKPSRLIALKAALAAPETDRDAIESPLRNWLQKQPDDRSANNILRQIRSVQPRKDTATLALQ